MRGSDGEEVDGWGNADSDEREEWGGGGVNVKDKQPQQ